MRHPTFADGLRATASAALDVISGFVGTAMGLVLVFALGYGLERLMEGLAQ